MQLLLSLLDVFSKRLLSPPRVTEPGALPQMAQADEKVSDVKLRLLYLKKNNPGKRKRESKDRMIRTGGEDIHLPVSSLVCQMNGEGATTENALQTTQAAIQP